MPNADQQFLEYVIKALVDNPNDVKVNRTVDEMGVLLTLEVSAADMGKIIGRQGNTAKSIRTLLRVVGMKNNSRVNLKINEPVGGLRSAEMQGQPGALSNQPVSSAPVQSSAARASKSVDDAMADLNLG
ncbi:MAG: KH domain-containing protein [Candidatus Taylorbacteria bacterium]